MARSTGRAGTKSARSRVRILKLVGPSGVGKTTLAERLIGRWTKRGLSVGYLKHAAHGFELDRPGKDSFRAAAAGASGVCLLGPTGIAYLEAATSERPEALVARFFGACDLVLVEGFSLAAVPTLLFTGTRGAPRPKPLPRGQVLALIAPKAVGSKRAARGRPVFARDDIEGIQRLVERRLRLRPRPAGTPGGAVT